MMRSAWGAVVLGLVLAGSAAGAPPAPPAKGLDPAAALNAFTGGDAPKSPRGLGALDGALASNLRAFLLKSLPDPLHEDARHWAKQQPGLRGRMRNEGRWWKVRAQAISPAETLLLDVRDLQKPGPGKTTFTGHLTLDVRVFLDRQTWRAGVRLYSGSTRARLRIKLAVKCEVTTRIQPNGTLFPDAVFRVRVLESNLRYDNLVVEHTAGVGGEAAKIIGDTLIGGARQFKPSLERDLLARANAAVVKAGDTKEVRVGLMSLFGGKKGALPLPAAKK